MRKDILVLCFLVFVLLLLQHDETRMLQVYQKYISIPCKCTCKLEVVTKNCGLQVVMSSFQCRLQTKQCLRRYKSST